MQYGWVTGCSSIYTNWAPGEPNNYFNNEDYVEAYLGKWNDHLPYHTNLCGCQLTSYTITDTPSSGPTVATSPRTSTAPSSDPIVACPMPCDGSAELYNCTCSSVVPLNQVMRITDSPINQRVICEGEDVLRQRTQRQLTQRVLTLHLNRLRSTSRSKRPFGERKTSPDGILTTEDSALTLSRPNSTPL